MSMKEHGRYQFSVRDQVVFFTASGSWNLPTCQSFSRELKNTALDFKGKPWAIVTDMRAWELGPPDIFEEVNLLIPWLDSHHLKFEALVVSNNVYKGITAKLRDDIPAGEETNPPKRNYETRFFLDHDEAVDWCQRQLTLYIQASSKE
ncbi:hypothetical protein L4C34_00210 [Vibrio profundum]|uniref:hypothetical protein n=1 Tax=Vibrio profundum TaxID=2910247 RepID=UPI003D13723A